MMRLLAISSAAVIAAAWGGIVAPAAVETGAKAVVGQPAPPFTLKDVFGKEFSLAEFKGHIVVLEWMNYECPYSKAHHQDKQTPQKLYARYAAKGVIWLAVDSTHGRKPADDRHWAATTRLAFPILMDPDGTVGHAFGAKTTPHVFVIDGNGVLAYAGAIDDMKGTNYVSGAIEALLDGKGPAPSETKPYGCTVKYGK
jgi:peroxiredoxin